MFTKWLTGFRLDFSDFSRLTSLMTSPTNSSMAEHFSSSDPSLIWTSRGCRVLGNRSMHCERLGSADGFGFRGEGRWLEEIVWGRRFTGATTAAVKGISSSASEKLLEVSIGTSSSNDFWVDDGVCAALDLPLPLAPLRFVRSDNFTAEKQIHRLINQSINQSITHSINDQSINQSSLHN